MMNDVERMNNGAREATTFAILLIAGKLTFNELRVRVIAEVDGFVYFLPEGVVRFRLDPSSFGSSRFGLFHASQIHDESLQSIRTVLTSSLVREQTRMILVVPRILVVRRLQDMRTNLFIAADDVA